MLLLHCKVSCELIELISCVGDCRHKNGEVRNIKISEHDESVASVAETAADRNDFAEEVGK